MYRYSHFSLIGKLIESGSLDIDKPIHEYLKEFSRKTFDGESVDITTRQLMSHTSGIRGYFTDPKNYGILTILLYVSYISLIVVCFSVWID